MTEAEWLACTDPRQMLLFLRDGEVNARKLRLFVCTECRRRQTDIVKPLFREALQTVERYTDGLASDHELAAASSNTSLVAHRRVNLIQSRAQGLVHWATQPDESMVSAAFQAVANKPAAMFWQSKVLRDLFGNPFAAMRIQSAWLTSNVIDLARTIYDERAFDRLPILADALMDAGCTDEAILSHCRQPGDHVRGCWVVDLILGKS